MNYEPRNRILRGSFCHGIISWGWLSQYFKRWYLLRRNRNQVRQNNTGNLLAEIERLKDSPLSSIFAELHTGLACIQAAYRAGNCSQLQVDSFRNQAHAVAQLMPKNFTDRFDLMHR